MQFASSGRYTFADEVESVRKEVEILQAQNVSIIVAIGHAGFEIAQKVAAEVEGVDLVISGGDHTFLYTGPKPGRDTPDGEYPFIVTQPSGKKVPIVQVSCCNIYYSYILLIYPFLFDK